MRFSILSVLGLAAVATATPLVGEERRSIHLAKRDFNALATDVATVGDQVLVVKQALVDFANNPISILVSSALVLGCRGVLTVGDRRTQQRPL